MVPKPDFERALVENFDVLYRMARALTGPSDQAEDLVQEASLRAMRAFPRLAHHDNLRSWFARVVHTTFLDLRRREQRQPTDSLEEHPNALEVQSVEAVEWQPQILREGFEDELQAHLDALGPGSRAVVQLVDVEGFRYEEVAEVLDVPIGTVRSRLFRARRALYEALGPPDASDHSESSSEESR